MDKNIFKPNFVCIHFFRKYLLNIWDVIKICRGCEETRTGISFFHTILLCANIKNLIKKEAVGTPVTHLLGGCSVPYPSDGSFIRLIRRKTPNPYKTHLPHAVVETES